MVPDLSKLPNVPLRIIAFALFGLTTWAALGFSWVGNGYILSNYFVVFLGIWSERDAPSHIPVQFMFAGMCFTFLNDILTLAIVYPSVGGSTAHFNAAMAIILIIAKPVAALFVYKEWSERANGPSGTSNYETFEGGNQQQYGSNGGFDQQPPPQYNPPNQPFP